MLATKTNRRERDISKQKATFVTWGNFHYLGMFPVETMEQASRKTAPPQESHAIAAVSILHRI